MFNVGTYLATRIKEIGIDDYFAVPGDFNLELLDQFLKITNLKMISCCNELNAGYAADGYARIRGASAMVVTYSVGGLSAVNAIAGAYAENLPVIIISGGPNTNSVQDSEILHHTLGNENYTYVQDIFSHICIHTVFIHRPEDAPAQIDKAIEMALHYRKPVYIEIACNIFSSMVSNPHVRSFKMKKESDQKSLRASVNQAAQMLNKAKKPIIVVGSHARACQVLSDIEKFSLHTKYAISVMADAKGFINEELSTYVGVYWGPVSSPGTAAVVESSDAVVFFGPNFNDYTTVGHMLNIHPEKTIQIKDKTVSVGGEVFTGIYMYEFMHELIKELTPNAESMKTFQRIAPQVSLSPAPKDINSPVSLAFLYQQVQNLLTKNHAILAETGDSWFNGISLHLPKGCLFEIQMQYGSIGWSVGALLGMQAALKNNKRVIALIGDGSFQMSAQELSTIIREKLKPIIFLINNGCYNIEVQIHDGPYNQINSWHYAKLMDVFNAEKYHAQGLRVKTCQELVKAIEIANQYDGCCLIEIMLSQDYCHKNLLEWGARVASYNARAPRGDKKNNI